MKRLRNYFKTVTSGLRADGTIGGTRFLKGDKPTEDVFKDLRESHPMFLESADRAKVTTGGGLGEEVGLVTLATNVQAKVNATQLSDRSLVVQPHQLPTVEPTVNDFTISTIAADGANSATQDPFDIVADTLTTTRNKFIVKFKIAFVKWLLRRVVPAGGTIGQALIKLSGVDYDYGWGTVAAGSAGGDTYKTTSTSAVLIGLGTKTFTVPVGLAYTKGVRARATNTADTTQFIEGMVSSYSGTSLVLTSDVIKGTGTPTSWTINLGGDTPQQVVTGVANLYVSEVEGSDAEGDGSINSPYATINKGVQMAGNNQTVVIFAGTYNNATNVVKNDAIRYTLSFFPNVIINQTSLPFYDSVTNSNCARVDIYGEPNINSNLVGDYCFYVKQVCKLYLGKIDCQQALSIQSYFGNTSGTGPANEITVVKVREINYYNNTPLTKYAIRFFGAVGTFSYTPPSSSQINLPAKNNSVDFSVYAINFVAITNTAGVNFIQIADVYSLFVSNSYIFHQGAFSLSFPVIFDFTGTSAPSEISVSNTSVRLGGNGVTNCTLFALGTMTLIRNFFKNIAVSINSCTLFSYNGTSNQAINVEDIYLLTGSTAINYTGTGGSLTIASGNQFSANGLTNAASTNSRIYLLSGTNGLATIKN